MRNVDRRLQNDKDKLVPYLIDSKKLEHWDSEELSTYINLFSTFICSSNPNYLYNIPFLREQHQKFRHFLNAAPQKYTALIETAAELSVVPIIKRLIDDKSYSNCTIMLSINDFLTINLRTQNEVRFHNHFSVEGAICSPKLDQFTFKIDSFIYSWNSCEKKISEAIEKIVELIQKLLYGEEE